MLLCRLFAGAGDDLQLGDSDAGGQDNINIRRIRGGSGDQPGGMFHACLSQAFLMGGVTNKSQPVANILSSPLIVFDTTKGAGFLASSCATLRPTRPAPQMM